ncbi:hypothetical protein L6164_020123 [Bauhinia variegata]|uniref:Uncharacterized protein n=1 Tax=Bauhinia variegata TaxID=167791 RepID=A0ACB9MW25_BAUVA|nr:hypothetical protein L6164_020123 [Bauhinia variegata]
MEQHQPDEKQLALVLYEPSILVKDEGRPSFQASDTTVDLMNVDQCQGVRDMEDSQLVGVPVALARDVDVAQRQDGCLPNSEVKIEVQVADGIVGKRKRGRPARGQSKTPPLKKQQEEEEDVCFICFDGGNLVLCDRRGCPKAYHPACIKRDEAFFRSKAKWNCGWHICSVCRKASYYMCYTCPYSLCKGCTKGADYVSVRGNKGLCGICMRTIMLIENSAQGNKEMCQVDFDDKSSWEYLFKVYWAYLKGKLSLTLDELLRAKNPWKGAAILGYKIETSHELHLLKDDKGSGSENSCIDIESNNLENKDIKRQEWASKELLEFVAHMRNGDTSLLSPFDAQNLLLEYVKKNNLRDPLQKCQIVCDTRLINLFGRERVGHIEMIKLLESHFLMKESTPPESIVTAGIIDAVTGQVESNGYYNNQLTVVNDKRRKTRKKVDVQVPQNNPDAYAAINAHNINLIYLRRNLMENLLEDAEMFHDKVVGSIVRKRISSNDQKQEMYRLVQVVGTRKVAEPYKTGTRTTDFVLEILNLNKKETISIDEISNQEFSEDECKRMRESIKYGLSRKLTVGEILDRALILQAVKVSDFLDAEILRLNHLRDRASEKGHGKEYPLLYLLSSPEERQRRLQEVPVVHSDPNIDYMFESDEDNGESGERKQDENRRLNDVGRRAQDLLVATPENPNTAATCDSNHVGVVRSEASGAALDVSSLPLPTGMEQSFNNFAGNKFWHYQDPTGKIQGPFSLLQLYKWNSCGHFPPDLRIWRINEDQSNSILLSDALDGKYHKSVSSGVEVMLDDVDNGKHDSNRNSEGQSNSGQSYQKQSDSEGTSGQSSGQNWRPPHVSSSSSCLVTTSALLSVTNPSPRNQEFDLPSPTPVTSSSNCCDSASAFISAAKPQNPEIDFSKLPSRTATPNNSESVVPASENRQSACSNVPIQDAGPSWSTASSLVGGATPLPEVTVEWRCSQAPPDPSVEEWDSNLVSASSLKVVKTVGDCAATPSSINDQLTHSPPSHPACNTSTWQAIIGEPNEFESLVDESVSDLLAEVEAMESLGGLDSASSIMRCGEELTEDSKTDCLSPADGLSPMPDAGKGDALSSTGDIQLASQSTAAEETLCQADLHHHQRVSGGHSSTSAEVEVGTKNSSITGKQWESSSKIPSTVPEPATSDMASDTTWRLGLQSNGGWQASQENVNVSMGWGGMDQANPSIAWGVGQPQGAAQVNRNINSYSSCMGTPGFWGSQPRYGNGSDRISPRDRGFHGNVRGRNVWNRQPPFGVGNGGSYRPPPKGQRVCKFYESGYCKKGASCGYLHP